MQDFDYFYKKFKEKLNILEKAFECLEDLKEDMETRIAELYSGQKECIKNELTKLEDLQAIIRMIDMDLPNKKIEELDIEVEQDREEEQNG